MPEETTPLETAIHSIFGFIQRTAEPAAHGLTWETINYKNQPHHSISVFNGVGGISFFWSTTTCATAARQRSS